MIKKLGYFRNKELILLRKVSKHDQDIFDCLKNQTNIFDGIQLLFLMSINNSTDIYNYYQYLNKQKLNTYEKLKDVSLNFNRLLINYLSSAKMFIDHTEALLKNVYGEDGENFLIWKEATHKEYEERFEYRFLYQFRNFTQHIGKQTLHINFKQSVGQPDELRIDFQKNILLNANFDWKPVVLEDLKRKPERLPVMPVLKTFTGCMFRLYQAALVSIHEDFFSKCTPYFELLNKAKIMGLPIVTNLNNDDELEKNKDKLNLNITNLPYDDLVKRLKEFEKYKVAKININFLNPSK
ncbi:hypothetical protein [Sporolactobacillus pectinivorans]|uniref:hypothetical protein n=1 Tax=Sporolactobacillus pectinivorans TaxID=1591408 RepID=UPI000C2569C7|nr:hypothetical protein [Sporolactobacillus pectinivorans]